MSSKEAGLIVALHNQVRARVARGEERRGRYFSHDGDDYDEEEEERRSGAAGTVSIYTFVCIWVYERGGGQVLSTNFEGQPKVKLATNTSKFRFKTGASLIEQL